MRSALCILSFVTFTTAFAQTGTLPPPANDPNVLVSNDGGIAIAQMMIENPEGVELLKKTHHSGPLMESGKVELVSQSQSNTGQFPQWTTVTKFSILSQDCLGTDACEGEYLWTVTATMTSDGYTYHTVYTNTVARHVRTAH